ncbi:MAG: hypothetical protein ACE5D7_09585, partial [Fidelibacterota bacterium]
LIRINQNTCVSCMMELEFWNQLENNPELEIVAVLEDSSFVSDLPESLQFQFPFILKDNFIFYFTELGDVEKILIDQYVNRIMFIDYASTSYQAHLAFKKVIEAILSYP